MDISFCVLCMHNMYMYICICLLSTVETGYTDMFYNCVIFVILN